MRSADDATRKGIWMVIDSSMSQVFPTFQAAIGSSMASSGTNILVEIPADHLEELSSCTMNGAAESKHFVQIDGNRSVTIRGAANGTAGGGFEQLSLIWRPNTVFIQVSDGGHLRLENVHVKRTEDGNIVGGTICVLGCWGATSRFTTPPEKQYLLWKTCRPPCDLRACG